MNQKKRIGSLIILAFVFFFVMSGEAQDKKGRRGDQKKAGTGQDLGFTVGRGPIDITSDTVEANQKQNTVTFKGNVVGKQEDITLYANTLVIFYDPDTKRLREIVATGNVKVVQLNRRATSQKATFHQERNEVVLDGEAVVREGENIIRGERITFYVEEERSVVEGGKGSRVSTRITPPPREEKKE